MAENKNILEVIKNLDQGKKEKVYNGALSLMSGILSGNSLGLAKAKLYQNIAIEFAYDLCGKTGLLEAQDYEESEEPKEEQS